VIVLGADVVAESGEFAVDVRYPQVGFSVARRTIRARMPAGIAGLPGEMPGVVQRRRTSCRCQRRIVAGVTRNPRRRRAGSRRAGAVMTARSLQLIRGRGVRRCNTAS
jgi:hypothetical protein